MLFLSCNHQKVAEGEASSQQSDNNKKEIENRFQQLETRINALESEKA